MKISKLLFTFVFSSFITLSNLAFAVQPTGGYYAGNSFYKVYYYNYNTSAPVTFPKSSASEACNAKYAPTPYNAVYLDVSGGYSRYSCQRASDNFASHVAWAAVASVTCPVNSTLTGSTCICNSGYTDSGSSCVPVPPSCPSGVSSSKTFTGSPLSSVCVSGCTHNKTTTPAGCVNYNSGGQTFSRCTADYLSNGVSCSPDTATADPNEPSPPPAPKPLSQACAEIGMLANPNGSGCVSQPNDCPTGMVKNGNTCTEPYCPYPYTLTNHVCGFPCQNPWQDNPTTKQCDYPSIPPAPDLTGGNVSGTETENTTPEQPPGSGYNDGQSNNGTGNGSGAGQNNGSNAGTGNNGGTDGDSTGDNDADGLGQFDGNTSGGSFGEQDSEITAKRAELGATFARLKDSFKITKLVQPSGSLPCYAPINVMGREISLCFTQYSDELGGLPLAFILMSTILAGFIILRG